MKAILGIGGLAGLLIFAAQAQGEQNEAPSPALVGGTRGAPLDWSNFAQPFGGGAPQQQRIESQAPSPELDVVDAHWMALTMWGEARGDGEAGMRAVGHVIDNRRKAGRHGAFVTDTVSEAFQFSAWNPGDPNREAMLNVETLPRDSHDRRLWLLAQRVADEILSGQSRDPTGGSLFYHSTGVAPSWSMGIPPVQRIGSHLFFQTAR